MSMTEEQLKVDRFSKLNYLVQSPFQSEAPETFMQEWRKIAKELASSIKVVRQLKEVLAIHDRLISQGEDTTDYPRLILQIMEESQ